MHAAQSLLACYTCHKPVPSAQEAEAIQAKMVLAHTVDECSEILLYLGVATPTPRPLEYHNGIPVTCQTCYDEAVRHAKQVVETRVPIQQPTQATDDQQE